MGADHVSNAYVALKRGRCTARQIADAMLALVTSFDMAATIACVPSQRHAAAEAIRAVQETPIAELDLLRARLLMARDALDRYWGRPPR